MLFTSLPIAVILLVAVEASHVKRNIAHDATMLNNAVVCQIASQVIEVATILSQSSLFLAYISVPQLNCGIIDTGVVESSSVSSSSSALSSASSSSTTTSSTFTSTSTSSLSAPTCTNAVDPSLQVKRRHAIFARQDTSTQYLPNIVNAATNTICQSTCQPFEDATTACVNQFSTNTALAQCSCEAMFLSQLQTCGKCEDTLQPGGYGNGNYTAFCKQCIAAPPHGYQPANFPCDTPLEPQVSGSYPPLPSSTSTPASSTSTSSSAPVATPVPFPTCLVPSCSNGYGVDYATNLCSVCLSEEVSVNTTDISTSLVSTRCVAIET